MTGPKRKGSHLRAVRATTPSGSPLHLLRPSRPSRGLTFGLDCGLPFGAQTLQETRRESVQLSAGRPADLMLMKPASS